MRYFIVLAMLLMIPSEALATSISAHRNCSCFKLKSYKYNRCVANYETRYEYNYNYNYYQNDNDYNCDFYINNKRAS